jgi:hypothetical protein
LLPRRRARDHGSFNTRKEFICIDKRFQAKTTKLLYAKELACSTPLRYMKSGVRKNGVAWKNWAPQILYGHDFKNMTLLICLDSYMFLFIIRVSCMSKGGLSGGM